MSTKSTALHTTDSHADDGKFHALLAELQHTFSTNYTSETPLFRTDTANLFEVYLSAFPEELRQHYNCNTCRSFLRRFAGLVVIDPETGRTRSPMWDGLNESATLAPEFRPVVAALDRAVRKAKIVGVFLSKHSTLGTPEGGGWEHLHVTGVRCFSHSVKTPGQAMAGKIEDAKNVTRALHEFSQETLDKVCAYLASGAIVRPEKFTAPANWLADLRRRTTVRGNSAENLVHLAVATAPDGFCHPRSSVLGTLLTDIADGVPFDAAAAKFKAKMDPLVYQRPQAAPSEGNIKAAEKLVETLGLAPSLRRRPAKLEEITSVWTPRTAPSAPADGVFGHLRNASPATAPDLAGAQTVTWRKFEKTVLGQCHKIEVLVPVAGSFFGFLTAAVPDAPPIIKWDREGARNPVSWYLYVRGSQAMSWGLIPGSLAQVTAITDSPAHWTGKTPGEAERVFLVLAGAVDKNAPTICLFPEILRPELREVRSTIERHSGIAKVEEPETGTANGIEITNGVRIRAYLTGGVAADYLIDRVE